MLFYIYEFFKTLIKNPRSIYKKFKELSLAWKLDTISKKVNFVVGTSDGDVSVVNQALTQYYSLNAYGANNHLARLVKYLDTAKYSIDIAVYAMNSPPINDVLLNARERGVEVRIITEKCYLRQFSKISAHGHVLEIPMVMPPSRPDRMMHHKVCIIDGYRRCRQLRQANDKSKTHGIMVTGSFNWIAFQRSYDDIFISSNFRLVNRMEFEYLRLWNAIVNNLLL